MNTGENVNAYNPNGVNGYTDGNSKVATEHLEAHPSNDHKRDIEDEAVAEYVPDTPEEKKLVRKIDIHLLPMLWVMYILNYVSTTATSEGGGRMLRRSRLGSERGRWTVGMMSGTVIE